jgi:hypothetical protein
MLQPIDISGGQVSGVDDLSSAPSSVVNWEVDEAGINRPRPGLATYTTTGLGTSPVIGMERWKNYIILVTTDRKLWAISDANPSLVQALSDSTSASKLEGTTRPVFVIGELYIYVAGGERIQRWAPGLALSEVITASPRCTHIAALGQRIIANLNPIFDPTTSNTYQWSDIGEGAWGTWPAANTSNADARPDPIVAVAENTAEAYVFGTETTQVYGIGSDPTLPFEQAAAVNIGLAAPYAFTRLDSEFALLDNRRRIVISDGRSAEPISDAIQKDLRGLTTISDAWMYREERGQYSLLVARFPTERRTFVYDMKSKKWTERDYYASPFHADFPVGAHVYWPTQNYHLFGSTLTAAGLLRLDATSRQDIAGALVCERIGGWQDFGSANRKRSSRIRAVMRRGTAAQGATPGALEVRVQNDEGPWSTWKQLSVGTPDQYQQTMDTYGCNGIFRRRRHAVRYSTTEDTSLVALYEDVTDLGSP